MAGGANSLELLWATLALAAVAAVTAVSLVAWVAIWVETRITGGPMPLTLWSMPGVLLDLAGGDSTRLDEVVVAWWRPLTVASIAGLLAVALVWDGARRWSQWRRGWRHRRAARNRVESHTWARRRDLAALLVAKPRPGTAEPPAGGRLLVGSFDGHDVLAPARTSVMVVAPTRTGKSTRLVVPNLLRWEGPAVVTSVKRDVYDLTVARRGETGPACLFDPTGSTGLPSVRWSPLLTSTTFPDATKTATWLADAASVEDKHEAAKFWETLATKLLAPMLYAAANTSKTMMDVSHWVDRSAFDEVARILVELGDEDASAAWRAIRDLPVETRGSVLGTAMAIFRGFGSPRVRRATSCTPGDTDDALDIADLLRRNGTLYLVSPEYEQAELRPVFVALVQAVYRAAVELSANLLGGAPLSPPLLMMLDEAGNIAPLHTLPKIASTGAGQGITLMTIWQDRAQIRQLYGESERTVISNHTTSVWLPGSQDLDTLKLLSDLIGDQWVESSTVSAAPDGGLSVSEGSERMDVAPPAFLRTLPHGTAVVLTGNTPPVQVTTQAYYELRRWRRLVGEAEVARHTAMHDGTGPTTAERWKERGWPEAALDSSAATGARSHASVQARRTRGGALGQALAADYPDVLANRIAHAQWEPAARAIPLRLTTEPRRWGRLELPVELAARIGDEVRVVDLADAAVRRHVLPVWMESGPAEEFAEHVTFPQLVAEWPHLCLTALLRTAWEECFPQLAGDWPLPEDDSPPWTT
ncbi:type IV secretory system conjugative DNA transfer family protein [Nitriliruptor alkaliphilus]|uniref:type IV secretory system conjugative DNA transfer family protein n=1 Tax=Nitriliruptor alkaliphilus TaxID=427918 RepID=UPI001B8082B1|nr:type IV secretory system conjugative DNA transfer family protein [Nitriliruptor alkaliphilus]